MDTAVRPATDSSLRLLNDWQHGFPLCRDRFGVLAAQTGLDREEVLAQLQAAVDRRNPVSTLCYAAIRWMGVPYLKKNAGELQVRMRRQYLRAVAAGDLPHPGEVVLAEVRARTPGA